MKKTIKLTSTQTKISLLTSYLTELL